MKKIGIVILAVFLACFPFCLQLMANETPYDPRQEHIMNRLEQKDRENGEYVDRSEIIAHNKEIMDQFEKETGIRLPEDDDVYGEDWEVSLDEPRDQPKEIAWPAIIILGAIPTLLIGSAVCFWLSERKKRKNQEKE